LLLVFTALLGLKFHRMAAYAYQRLAQAGGPARLVADGQRCMVQQQKLQSQPQPQQQRRQATAKLLERQQQVLQKLLAQQYEAVGQLLVQHRLELEHSVVHQASPDQPAQPLLKDPGSSSSDEEAESNAIPQKARLNRGATTTTLSIMPTNRFQECCLHLMSSHAFQVFMGTVIVMNAIFLGVHAHWEITSIFEGVPLPLIVENAFTTLKRSFFILFCAEMGIRLAAEQRHFFNGRNKFWNWFELLALLSMAVELFDVKEIQEYLSGMSALRLVRLLRIIRAVRVIRVFQFFKQLRFMLYSVLSCLLSMTWAIVLLVIWMYLFGLYLEDAAIDYAKEHGKGDPVAAALTENWNGILCAIRSLVYSVSGGADWGDLASPFWAISWVNGVLYTLFMVLTVFGLLNILVGIFVQEAGQIAAWDRDLVLQGLAEKKEFLMENLSDLFDEIAAEGADRITMEDFRRAVRDEHVQSYFEHLEINCSKLKTLFGLLDMDHDGYLSKKEFVTACMQLHGDAKSTEVAHLLMESKAIRKKVDHLENNFDELVIRLAGPVTR